LSHRVGASLQRTDEFGRILTPKESFRDVSYAFHGYHRAASKIEKNLKKLKRDRAQSGLVDEKDTSYYQSRNPSQLVDDFKARKWKPAYQKGGKTAFQAKASAVKSGKKEFIDKYVAQAAAAAAEQAANAAAAALPAAVALPGRDADGSGEIGGPKGGTALKKGGDEDYKLMPPPPPPRL
jgi:hypothetical protein